MSLQTLWRRLHETTIWRYAPDTPSEVLARHYRRAMGVVGVAFWSGGLMFSAMLEMLLSEPGWWRTFWVFVAIPASLIAVVTLLPSILAGAWAHQIARECVARGVPGIDPQTLDRATWKIAMKAMGYFAAILFAANVLGRDPELRPVAVGLSLALTIACLIALLRGPRPRVAMTD